MTCSRRSSLNCERVIVYVVSITVPLTPVRGSQSHVHLPGLSSKCSGNRVYLLESNSHTFTSVYIPVSQRLTSTCLRSECHQNLITSRGTTTRTPTKLHQFLLSVFFQLLHRQTDGHTHGQTLTKIVPCIATSLIQL